MSGGVAVSPAVCSGVSGRVYGVSRSSGDIQCQFQWYSNGGVLLRSYSRVLLTVSPFCCTTLDAQSFAGGRRVLSLSRQGAVVAVMLC